MFEGNRLANRNGINGSDEIVTVVDTGLDMYHSFFSDKNHQIPFDVTDLSHLNVVRYEVAGDAIERESGHGTHVAGNPDCDDCGLKMYSGIAPEAKLYFIDIEKGSKVAPTFKWREILENMRNMDSYVITNSWRFPRKYPEYIWFIDRLSYDYPGILFIFSAGNTDEYFDIKSPVESWINNFS